MLLLLCLYIGNFGFDGIQDVGNDLCFVLGDGCIVLVYQIEQFDFRMGMVLVWVDVLVVSVVVLQIIWMYYGNEKVLVSGNGQQVFDLDYMLVYYFVEVNVLVCDIIVYGNNVGVVVLLLEGLVIGRGVQLGVGLLLLLVSVLFVQEVGVLFIVLVWIKLGSNIVVQVIYVCCDGVFELVLGIENWVLFVQFNGQCSMLVQLILEG